MTAFPIPASSFGSICKTTSELAATSSSVSSGFVIVGTVKQPTNRPEYA